MVDLILKYKFVNYLTQFKLYQKDQMDLGQDNVERRYFKWQKRISTEKWRIFIDHINTADKSLGTSHGSNATRCFNYTFSINIIIRSQLFSIATSSLSIVFGLKSCFWLEAFHYLEPKIVNAKIMRHICLVIWYFLVVIPRLVLISLLLSFPKVEIRNIWIMACFILFTLVKSIVIYSHRNHVMLVYRLYYLILFLLLIYHFHHKLKHFLIWNNLND